jgi:hypothetical protein
VKRDCRQFLKGTAALGVAPLLGSFEPTLAVSLLASASAGLA